MHKILPGDITIRKGTNGELLLDIKGIVIEHPKGKPSESGKTLQFAFASSGKTLQVGDHKGGRVTVRLEVPTDNSAPSKKLF